ncbi:MAG: alpha/beta hydrolase [Burkholderiales bacterium]
MIDGITLQIEGRGSRTVLMLHGWPDTAALWEPQVQALRHRARCVRFTLPGFDRTHPRRVYDLDEIVATVHHIVLAVSRTGPVTLLLHDWGCVFGYRFAQAHPECVEAIIAVDVGDAGSREHVAELPTRAKAAVATYQLLLALAWHLPAWLGDALTRRVARWARAPADPDLMGRHMNYPYHVQWTRGYGSRPFRPQVPMLFVWGMRKPFMFHSRAWLAGLSANPSSRTLGLDTGHWVAHQGAASFNNAMLDWLDHLEHRVEP